MVAVTVLAKGQDRTKQGPTQQVMKRSKTKTKIQEKAKWASHHQAAAQAEEQ